MKGWKNLPKAPTTKQTSTEGRLPFLFAGVRIGSFAASQNKIRIVSEPLFAMVHWVGLDRKQLNPCPFVICQKFDPETNEMKNNKICVPCRTSKPVPKYFTVVRDLKEDNYPLKIFVISPDLLEEISKKVILEKIDKYIIVIESRRSKDNPRKMIYTVKSKETDKLPPQEVYAEAAELLERFKKYLGIKAEDVKELSKKEETKKQIEEDEEDVLIENEELEEELEEEEEEDEPFPKKKSAEEFDDEISEDDIEDIDELDEDE
jgi:hypothetical protein